MQDFTALVIKIKIIMQFFYRSRFALANKILPDFDIQLKIIYSSVAGQGLAANRTVCCLTQDRQAVPVGRMKYRQCIVGLHDCNSSDVIL